MINLNAKMVVAYKRNGNVTRKMIAAMVPMRISAYAVSTNVENAFHVFFISDLWLQVFIYSV